MRSFAALVVVISLAACPSSDAPLDAAGLDAAVPDSGCAAPNVLRYENPGCSAQPRCGNPTEDLCLIARCSCRGQLIGGCDYYQEPWLDVFVPRTGRVGDSCATDGP